jgi:hypothetical protein
LLLSARKGTLPQKKGGLARAGIIDQPASKNISYMMDSHWVRVGRNAAQPGD